MNAMNFIFVPNGLSVATLEDYFDRCYRAFYSRPRVLWGLARAFAKEPSYIPRFLSYARAYVRGSKRVRYGTESARPIPAPSAAAGP
jgi:hypothetical protein